MSGPVFVLGGAQTDFARNYSRDGLGVFELMSDAVIAGLESVELDARDIESAHVGNFVGELFARQGHLGGLFAAIDPAFDGLPCVRHEAACASGSAATIAAMTAVEAGHCELACIVGVEQMRNVPGLEAAENLAVAAWSGREGEDARFLWPAMFSALMDEYEERYGLDYAHLMAIAEKNFDNAKRNPRAQTRGWTFDAAAFSCDDQQNPQVEGRVRRQDCSQITDGAAAVFLASQRFAESYAQRTGRSLTTIPRILGWGHRTATMRLEDKLERTRGRPGHVFPHVARCAEDARQRAGLELAAISAFEVHDCFAITEYMLTEHLGLAGPGKGHTLIESNATRLAGPRPVNPSGGLIGVGHPVGATGVRMVLDGWRQLCGTAGDYQVEGASAIQTMNIGGSATTAISFVLGCDA